MNPSVGFAVATVGLVIMAGGVVGANVVFFRFMPKLMNRRSAVLAQRREGLGVPRTDQRMAYEFVYALTLFAAIGMFGLTIMLVGLVVGGNVVNWAPLAPLAVALLALAIATYTGQRLRQLRNV